MQVYLLVSTGAIHRDLLPRGEVYEGDPLPLPGQGRVLGRRAQGGGALARGALGLWGGTGGCGAS